MNDLISAVAVPVPLPSDNSSDYKNHNVNERQSSYKLPKGTKNVEIQSDALKHLKDQGFTDGLAAALIRNTSFFPLRIWIVDNSGSMRNSDGHRIVPTKNKNDVKLVACTRWAEIKDTVNYHAQMAAMLKAPTVFRLLNHPGAMVGPQQFSIAENSRANADIMNDVHNATKIMNKTSPSGVTPLISHILEIQHAVREMAPELRKEGKRVSIILATDGLPTDDYGTQGELIRQQFVESLRLLEGLPVWIIVRLCTDEEDVVNFYNDLDEQLELSLEVLDDFVGEAAEVYEKNPWLNYALPLHRCRELGFYDRLFDMLDERALTKGELLEFFALLFGEGKLDGVTDPEEDWGQFLKSITRSMESESKQWNPIKKKMSPWIDLKSLNKMYGSKSEDSCAIM